MRASVRAGLVSRVRSSVSHVSCVSSVNLYLICVSRVSLCVDVCCWICLCVSGALLVCMCTCTCACLCMSACVRVYDSCLRTPAFKFSCLVAHKRSVRPSNVLCVGSRDMWLPRWSRVQGCSRQSFFSAALRWTTELRMAVPWCVVCQFVTFGHCQGST